MAFLGWGHRSTPSKESSCSSCSVFLSFFLSFAPLLDGTELNSNECSNDCATRVCIVSSDQTARERFLSFFFFLSLPNRSLEVSVPSRTRERARENFPNFFPISFDDVERPPRYNDKERATTTRKKTRNVNTNKKEKRGARKTKQRKGRRTS